MTTISYALRARRVVSIAAVSLLLCSVTHARDNALRVSEADANRAATKKVNADYPVIARQMNLTGRVEIEFTIDVTGSVETASIKVGNPVLGSSALWAIKKWKFTPFTEDGKPTAAISTMSFEFRK